MNTIELLDNLEVGMPLIITTKWQDIVSRRVALYGGTKGDGIYNFIDDTGAYRMTPRYIREHCKISQELECDGDIFAVAKLIDKVKEVK